MDFLALCRKVAQKCDLTASSTIPAAVTGQAGDLLKTVNDVAEAYTEIQAGRRDWRWLTSRFALETVDGTAEYVYGDADDEVTAAAITRFSHWRVNDANNGPTCYLQSAGIGQQYWLTFLPWARFRQVCRIGTVSEGQPTYITVSPTNQLVLWPTPNDVYVVEGEYQKSPQSLAANGDTPEMPDSYHMLIVYDAMRKYAYRESAQEVLSEADRMSGPIRSQLLADQGAQFTFAGSMA